MLSISNSVESLQPKPPSLPSPNLEFGAARMIRAVCCRTRAVSSGRVEDAVDDWEEVEGDGRVKEEGVNPIWPDMNV
jgi:hypothetical protein